MYDNSGTIIESLKGPYSIAITLSSGVLFGSSSDQTRGGVLTISDLRILSAGSISITATSNNIISDTSAAMQVTNYVYSITVTSSNLTPTMNFVFTVTATLLGEDGKLFTGNCLTTLTESGGNAISGTTSQQTATGTATFSIYFAMFGSMTMVATCSSIYGSLAITVPDLSLRIDSITPIVRNT